MSSQGGRGGGGKNCQFYLVKRQLRGGEGVKNQQFWDDIVYEWPLRENWQKRDLDGQIHAYIVRYPQILKF